MLFYKEGKRKEASIIKKSILFWCFYFLLFLSVFAGCRKNVTITGEVISQPTDALVVQTENGPQGVLLDKETVVLSMVDGIEAEDLLTGRLKGLMVTVSGNGAKTILSTTAYGDLSAIRAQSVTIADVLFQNDLTLSDGTSVDIWRGAFGSSYRLEDRTELFFEYPFTGPSGQASEAFRFEDLSETARVRILAYFELQGRLYDVRSELEQAYSAYRNSSSDFTAFAAQQEILPGTAGKSVVYFVMRGMISRTGGQGEMQVLGTAFDRNLGKPLSSWDLFTVSKEEAENTLFDLAGVENQAERSRLISLLKDQSLVFLPEGLEIWISGSEVLYVPYTEALTSILLPGAIPQNLQNVKDPSA